jgi:putative Ca2+/H+ antiporter (TMEM165/GDT1 family)
LDALLTTFISSLFAEFGDKTQLLVAVLAAGYRRPTIVIAALGVAAAVSAAIAAVAGIAVHAMVTARAATLLVALALLYAGGTGLFRAKQPETMTPGKTPLFVVAFICLLAAEMGDKTQFLTFALAARFDSLALAAVGSTAGVIVASVPAAALGAAYGATVPIRPIRIAIAAVFLLAGAITALGALRLI